MRGREASSLPKKEDLKTERLECCTLPTPLGVQRPRRRGVPAAGAAVILLFLRSCKLAGVDVTQAMWCHASRLSIRRSRRGRVRCVMGRRAGMVGLGKATGDAV
ncbi:hypothetical protein HYPSUDRAFT_50024, partial [Hypholoma sublateritium FD-334 SS-4]